MRLEKGDESGGHSHASSLTTVGSGDLTPRRLSELFQALVTQVQTLKPLPVLPCRGPGPLCNHSQCWKACGNGHQREPHALQLTQPLLSTPHWLACVCRMVRVFSDASQILESPMIPV